MKLDEETQGLLMRLASQCNVMHALGDIAAQQSEGAKTRKDQRNRQSANRAWRDGATAAEASLWLVTAMARANKGSASVKKALSDANVLVEDLRAEAYVVEHYRPQPRRESKA